MSTQPIGLDSALSRIQQIEAQQQQLLALPGAPAVVGVASGAATPATTGTSLGGSGTGASAAGPAFATLLAGLTGTATPGAGTSSSLGALSSLTGGDPALLGVLAALPTGSAATAATGAVGTAGAVPAAVGAMTTEANALVGKPYLWGGGHSGWGPQPGYDCSGFVSAVLHAGGYLASPQDTQTLPSAAGIEAGPGQYVTIYDRTDAGLGADHVIIDLNGQFYESGGEAGPWGGGGGVQRIATPPASYLATFNQVLHPAGL